MVLYVRPVKTYRATAMGSEPRDSASSDLGADGLRIGLGILAAYHLAIAAFMAFDAHSFFTSLGPFDAYNSHYIHDTATFEAALGFGFLVSLRRPSWRVPVI